MLGSLSVPEHPTGATFFDRYVDQAIAGEATPCLELGADAWIAANHGHEVALTAAAERSYQIRQEARGKCLGAGVEFNARVRSHVASGNPRRSGFSKLAASPLRTGSRVPFL